MLNSLFNAKEVLALAQRLLHKQGFHLKAAKTKIMPYYKTVFLSEEMHFGLILSFADKP